MGRRPVLIGRQAMVGLWTGKRSQFVAYLPVADQKRRIELLELAVSRVDGDERLSAERAVVQDVLFREDRPPAWEKTTPAAKNAESEKKARSYCFFPLEFVPPCHSKWQRRKKKKRKKDGTASVQHCCCIYLHCISQFGRCETTTPGRENSKQ